MGEYDEKNADFTQVLREKCMMMWTILIVIISALLALKILRVTKCLVTASQDVLTMASMTASGRSEASEVGGEAGLEGEAVTSFLESGEIT